MTENYTPDQWVLLKVQNKKETIYKVFGTWVGDYFGRGDYWRMNSGIAKVLEDENYYYFYGYSGSCYQVDKLSQGTTAYSQSVLHNLLRQSEEHDYIDIEVVYEPLKVIMELKGGNSGT